MDNEEFQNQAKDNGLLKGEVVYTNLFQVMVDSGIQTIPSHHKGRGSNPCSLH